MNTKNFLIAVFLGSFFVPTFTKVSLEDFADPIEIIPEQNIGNVKSQNYTPEKDLIDFKEDVTSKKLSGSGNEDLEVPPQLISIRFEDESLVDVIQYIASEKGANIILPIGDKEIKNKVTIQLPEKLTIDGAWNFLETLIDLAGYIMTPLPDNSYVIKKGVKPSQEPLPIYIGVWDEDLAKKVPNTDEYVRCLIYLSNIKLSNETSNEFTTLLNQLLPTDAPAAGGAGFSVEGKKFVLDPLSNALIIAERGRVIRSLMHVISSLERTGFRENYEIIQLYNANAETVANLFNNTILKPEQTQRFMPGATRRQSEATYFSRYVHIIPEMRLNALLVFGKDQAIDRIRSFVRTYIDVAPERGESILHVVQLQYLDASEFRPVLQSILSMEGVGETGQSRVATGQASVERYFEGPPIVLDDTPQGQETPTTTDSDSEGESTIDSVPPQYWGGNKLIIVARHNDWVRIEKLIEELDVPRSQVIIEVLVADLTIDDNRLLGGMLRNPLKAPLPGDLQFQSGQLGRVYLDNLDTPKTIALDPQNCANNVDILRQEFTCSTSDSVTSCPAASTEEGANASFANTVAEGTALIGFDDENKKTWGMLEVRQLFADRKVISYPHVIATDNQTAKIVIGDSQLLRDIATSSSGGATNIPYKWVDANLEINITPRISVNVEGTDLVQLGIHVNVTDFTGISVGDRVTREVVTSALLGSGDVLPLGGLLRSSSTVSTTRTPFLGQIPIIGYFFKRRTSTAIKTNLTVFLCPTVIQPRFRAGAALYTRDYVKLTKKYIEEGGLFASLQDPVNRWFFNQGLDPEKEMDDFIAQDEFKRDMVGKEVTQQDVDESFIGERKIMNPEITSDEKFVADAEKEKALKDIMAQLDVQVLDKN